VNSMLEASLDYASKGWHVFPVNSRNKRPLTDRGFHDATTNPEQIRKWWARWPWAAIGIALAASRLIGVDVDARDNGRQHWVDAVDEHDIKTNTVTCLTGGGGLHLYYRVPENIKIPNSKDQLAPGIEIKSNGYLIAPPSKHPGGNLYRWELSSTPDNCELLPFPEELINLSIIKPAAPSAKGIPNLIPAGQRNNTLTSMAGAMRRKNCQQGEIYAALKVINDTRCQPPLSDREVHEIAKGILRYEPQKDPSDKPKIKFVGNKDTVTSLFNKILETITPTNRFFNFNNGLVYIQPQTGLVLLDSKNLSGFLLKYFEIKHVYAKKDGNEILLNYKVISRDHIYAFLSNPDVKEGLPQLKLYTQVPVFDESWKLINHPGYHADPAIYYDGPTIRPSASQAGLDNMLRDVRWKEQSDKANFIGMLITGLTMTKWIGHHPFMVLNANRSQIGKGTLARMLGIIIQGKIPSTISYNHNQIELEKTIATEIEKGNRVIIIDNVKGVNVSMKINSPVLERCITDYHLNFRKLGSNTSINRQNDVIFITTMNESKLSTDLRNRDIPINLETKDIAQKLQFSITSIDQWVLDNRVQLISELLGMICHWVDQGRKVNSEAKHTLSSEWAQTIDSILKANGVLGFLENYEDANRDYDDAYDVMVEICEHYHEQDFQDALSWASLLSDNSLQEKLTDHQGKLKPERSQKIIVGRLFSEYEGKTIICDSDEYTICRKEISKRPVKHAYKFEKIVK